MSFSLASDLLDGNALRRFLRISSGEIALMCAVHNIKKAAKQEIPLPSYD